MKAYEIGNLVGALSLDRQIRARRVVARNMEQEKKDATATKDRQAISRRLAKEKRFIKGLEEQRKALGVPTPMKEWEALAFIQAMVSPILYNAEYAIDRYYTVLKTQGIAEATERAAAAIGGEYIRKLFNRFKKWDWTYSQAIELLEGIVEDARKKADRFDPMTSRGNPFSTTVAMAVFTQAKALAGQQLYCGESVPTILQEAKKNIDPGLAAGQMLLDAGIDF